MKEFQTFICSSPDCRIVDQEGLSIVFKNYEAHIPVENTKQISFLREEIKAGSNLFKEGQVVTEDDLNPVLVLKKKLREEILEELEEEKKNPLAAALSKQSESK